MHSHSDPLRVVGWVDGWNVARNILVTALNANWTFTIWI